MRIAWRVDGACLLRTAADRHFDEDDLAAHSVMSLAERGLVSNGAGYTLTAEGRDLVGPVTSWLRPIKAGTVVHRGEGFAGMFSIRKFG